MSTVITQQLKKRYPDEEKDVEADMVDTEQHLRHELVDPTQQGGLQRGERIHRRKYQRVLGNGDTTINSDSETRTTLVREE
jgi:hypothetical protein